MLVRFCLKLQRYLIYSCICHYSVEALNTSEQSVERHVVMNANNGKSSFQKFISHHGDAFASLLCFFTLPQKFCLNLLPQTSCSNFFNNLFRNFMSKRCIMAKLSVTASFADLFLVVGFFKWFTKVKTITFWKNYNNIFPTRFFNCKTFNREIWIGFDEFATKQFH